MQISLDLRGRVGRIGYMIELKEIRYSYDQEPVLNGLSVVLSQKDFTVILGPNGAGKSTLLYTIMGFLKPQSGEILLEGKSLSAYKRGELARKMAFVAQESVFSFDYTVQDMILMGRYPYQGLLENLAPRDLEMARKAMASLGLTEYAQRWYSQLSGGEKQRVLLARALAQETDYILLDESLSQLDINHQIEIMSLLSRIQKEQGKGIVLISHNLNLAANFASRMILLKQGVLMGSGNPEEMMQPELLQQVFGLELQTTLNPLSGRMNILYPVNS